MEQIDIHTLKKTIYARIDELPTLPVVVPKILKLVENDRTSATDLTDVISKDPALTAKILKAANSAYYGFSQEINSLDHAVALLGLNMVKSLALSIGVVRSLPSQERHPTFSREGLWMHCLAVASTVRELGNRRLSGRESDYLFVLGLLHDIGKLVLDQFFHEPFQQAMKAVGEPDTREPYQAERLFIGLDHGEIGAMLLTRWQFPSKIIGPIAVHHRHTVQEGTSAWDTALIRVADVIARQINLGETGHMGPADFYPPDLDMLNLTESDLAELKKHLDDRREEIQDFFQAMQ